MIQIFHAELKYILVTRKERLKLIEFGSLRERFDTRSTISKGQLIGKHKSRIKKQSVLFQLRFQSRNGEHEMSQNGT